MERERERDYNESAKRAVAEHAGTTGSPMGMAVGGRQSGKNALLGKVRQLRQQADRIEALAMAIPENFPLDADAGLWDIAQRVA